MKRGHVIPAGQPIIAQTESGGLAIPAVEQDDLEALFGDAWIVGHDPLVVWPLTDATVEVATLSPIAVCAKGDSVREALSRLLAAAGTYTLPGTRYLHFLESPSSSKLETVSAFIPGLPVPQGSKKIGTNRRTGKAIPLEQAGKRLDRWRADIGWAFKAAMKGHPPIAVPCAVTVHFLFPSKRGESGPYAKAPDLDKLQRAAFDAMTGIVYADDRLVVTVTAHKRYAYEHEAAGASIAVEWRP